MRQAALLLVHFPSLAPKLDPDTLTALAALDEPGADILRALTTDLRAAPCTSTGALLERWRERPEAERLAKLAATETLIHQEGGALREFGDAVLRMAAEGRRRRLEALVGKERTDGLSAEERLELQQLISDRRVQAG